MPNIFEKTENKFNPNKLSINPNKNAPKLKNPIEMEKKSDNLKKKERERKRKLHTEMQKKKVLDIYRSRNITKFMTAEEKEINKKKKEVTNKTQLKKLYKQLLIDEKKQSKKKKRETFILLYQKGKLNPENLFELEKEIPNIKYDLENMNDDGEYEEGEDDEEVKNDVEHYIKNVKPLPVGSGIYEDNIQILEASYIDKKYHALLAILNINIPMFFKFEKKYATLDSIVADLRAYDLENGIPASDNYKRKAIIVYIMKHLSSHNIFFKEFKFYLKNYFKFVSDNIHVNGTMDTLAIFIVMHETFITNDFWMMFPKENKHFFTYIIERIFQTVEEGKTSMIENFKKKKATNDKIQDAQNLIDDSIKSGLIDGKSENKSLDKTRRGAGNYDAYNIINSDNIHLYTNINLLQIVQKKSDKHPFFLYRKIRTLWEYDDNKDKHNKHLFILAAAKKGIVHFILLSVLSVLHKKDGGEITFEKSDHKRDPTYFIAYLNNNLPIINTFLNTGIDNITKDSNISNSDKKDKLLRYLWAEYKILTEI
tara:strand:- start:2785 stop:4398 length:1614 start_codon:yes stop_codon:yes gene_type:complete